MPYRKRHSPGSAYFFLESQQLDFSVCLDYSMEGPIFETTRHTNRRRIESTFRPSISRASHEGGFSPTLSYPNFARPIREGAKRALSRSARPGSRAPGPGAMAGESLQGELDWGFSQVFGERSPGEEVQDGASRT